MSQPKKRVSQRKPAEKTPSPDITTGDRKGRWSVFIIAGLVVIIALSIFGIGYYQNYVAPFQRIIITVDDTTINMDYFLKRSRLANLDPMTTMTAITNEQLVKLEAPNYGIEASPADVDNELRRMARGESETISDSEFREWYRQLLNETGLSDREFRENVTSGLLTIRLHEYLAERVPTVAEQVHLHVILLEEYEEAVEVRARWEAGEDFADLAREVSLDEASKENGGDIGWVPRGISDWVDYWVFDLNPGEVSEPIMTTEEGGFHLAMVSEKTDARELDADALEIVKSLALEKWLAEIRTSHKIEYNFNSEIYAWLNWQLAKDTEEE